MLFSFAFGDLSAYKKASVFLFPQSFRVERIYGQISLNIES